MAVYRKRKAPAYRVKRNFRRVARKLVKVTKPKVPKKTNGDSTDRLKITMHRDIYKRDMLILPDQSMIANILFNPTRNVSTTFSNGICNLFYHPSASKLTEGLFSKYRCACVVMKISRPNVNMCYNNATPNQAQQVKLATIPWGTKILHSVIKNTPDSYNSTIQASATLTPQMKITAPTSWLEAVDDGKRLFINHHYKRTCTRVWKPVNDFERRYVALADDDRELARGGIHIHMESNHPIAYDRTEPTNHTSNQWNYAEDCKLFDIECTIYMQYKDRT